jgi:hypothetical protein
LRACSIGQQPSVDTSGVAEVICHRQALEPPTIGQAVADEVHAPHLIDRARQLQRHPLTRRALGLPALAHRQVRRAVKPVDPLVVDAGELGTQKIVDPPIAEAPPLVRNLDDLVAEPLRCFVSLWRMSVAVAGKPHKTARAALGKVMLAHHLPNCLALGLWG